MSKEFLGEYKVIRKVGEGGMAEVFLAHHKDVPDHRVILKKLKDPSLGKSFRKEANNLAKLNEHQNICTIFHFFTDDDKTIIVMQYIEGATLKDIIESEKKLPVSVVLKLAVDLLRIISYAHERKIYHRDIKPGNIMVDKQGDFNGDGDNADVLDLTYIVNYIFRGGTIPGCPKEADLNFDGNSSNILDLTYLVDFIFRGGFPPANCITK